MPVGLSSLIVTYGPKIPNGEFSVADFDVTVAAEAALGSGVFVGAGAAAIGVKAMAQADKTKAQDAAPLSFRKSRRESAFGLKSGFAIAKSPHFDDCHDHEAAQLTSKNLSWTTSFSAATIRDTIVYLHESSMKAM